MLRADGGGLSAPEVKAMGRIRWLVLALSILPAGPGRAAEVDVKGGGDHPMLTRMPNFYIQRYEQQQFGSYSFNVGQGAPQAVAGRFTKIDYTLKKGSPVPSPIEIMRNCENAVTKIGGKVLWDNGKNQAVLQVARGGQETWVHVIAIIGPPKYQLVLVDRAAMKQEVTASADAWMGDISATGRAAVYGIYFDTDQSELKPESDPALAEMGKLLRDNPGLSLWVVGHTDATGDLAHNMKLSADRAAAVVKALASRHGVAAARLEAHGVGPLAPAASNRTEEGRSRNRRVELVERR